MTDFLGHKIHKRRFARFTMCKSFPGVLEIAITDDWNKVECKNCLRHRKYNISDTKR